MLFLLFVLQVVIFEIIANMMSILHFVSWYVLPALFFVYMYWRLTALRRRLERVPISRISEIKQGPVRLKGRVKQLYDLVVPDTEIKVAYLKHDHWIIEGEMVSVTSTDSSDKPFYVVDYTGRVLVDPLDAVIDTTTKYKKEKTKYARLLYMKESYHDYFFLPEGELVTVVGFAREREPGDSLQKKLVVERLREIKSDPELLAKYDRNGDGKLDGEKWEAVRRAVTEEVAARPLERIERLIIGKPPLESVPYYIGRYSAMESFRWKFMIALAVYAGLTLLMIVPMYFGSLSFLEPLFRLLED